MNHNSIGAILLTIFLSSCSIDEDFISDAFKPELSETPNFESTAKSADDKPTASPIPLFDTSSAVTTRVDSATWELDIPEPDFTDTSKPQATKTPIPQLIYTSTPKSTSTSQPSPTNPPSGTDHDGVPMALIPFDYSLTDIGNGWSEGVLSLAVENISDQHFSLGSIGAEWIYRSFELNLGPVIVETVEGPTYEAENTITLTLHGPIPPGYRVKSTYYTSQGIDDRIRLYWKSATIATPSRIHFEEYPEFSFDLPMQGDPGPKFPVEDPDVIHSTSDIEGEILELGSMEMEFTGNCGFGLNRGNRSPGPLEFEVNLSNGDPYYGVLSR